MEFDKAGELLKAIGHPVRLKILTGLVASDECNVNTIVAKLKIPQSTASQHLGILRTRGIIAPRKEGVSTCYRIADKRIVEILKIFAR